MLLLDVFTILTLLTFFFSYIYTEMRLQNKLKVPSILFLLVSFVSSAQETGNPPPPMPPPPPGLPIDGNVIFVLALGLVFGCYFRIKFSKLKETK
jgi:hypothetical protein